MRRIPRFLIVGLSAVGWISAGSAQAPSPQFLLSLKPQYQNNSCRAYAPALALGTVANSPFPITTTGQLRQAERDLQARYDSTADKMQRESNERNKDNFPFFPSSHVVWKRAIEEMTSKALTAAIEYEWLRDDFYKRVGDLTQNPALEQLFKNPNDGTVVNWSVTPVITSVLRIGKDRYPDGHIVTIYGLAPESRPITPIATRGMVILNSAVKVPDVTRSACDIDQVPNDTRWSAGLSMESDYDLKLFPDGYLIMRIIRPGNADRYASPPSAPTNLRVIS